MLHKESNKIIFGILIGVVIIALISLVIVLITSSFNFKESEANKSSIKNNPITFEDNTDSEDQPAKITLPEKEEEKSDSENKKIDNNKNKEENLQATDIIPEVIEIDIEIRDDDHIRGDKNAPITIIEYSDFQCSYCTRFHETMNQVMNNYDGKVRWVYRHYPISTHLYASKAAEASECAAAQGKFWEYNDALFKNQEDIENGIFNQLAKEIGLNSNSFEQCLDSGKYKEKVETDHREGKSLGVTGTPGNFINGKKLRGAMPYEMLKDEIDQLL